jgi:hypothetical protein
VGRRGSAGLAIGASMICYDGDRLAGTSAIQETGCLRSTVTRDGRGSAGSRRSLGPRRAWRTLPTDIQGTFFGACRGCVGRIGSPRV